MTTPSPAPENPRPAAPDRASPARPGAHPLLAAAIRGTLGGAARAAVPWLIELIEEHIIH